MSGRVLAANIRGKPYLGKCVAGQMFSRYSIFDCTTHFRRTTKRGKCCSLQEHKHLASWIMGSDAELYSFISSARKSLQFNSTQLNATQRLSKLGQNVLYPYWHCLIVIFKKNIHIRII